MTFDTHTLQNTNGTWAVTKQSALERIAQISKGEWRALPIHTSFVLPPSLAYLAHATPIYIDGVQEVSMFRLLPTSNWPEEFWWDVLQSYITGTV